MKWRVWILDLGRQAEKEIEAASALEAAQGFLGGINPDDLGDIDTSEMFVVVADHDDSMQSMIAQLERREVCASCLSYSWLVTTATTAPHNTSRAVHKEATMQAYRVWLPEEEHWHEGDKVEAHDPEEAAALYREARWDGIWEDGLEDGTPAFVIPWNDDETALAVLQQLREGRVKRVFAWAETRTVWLSNELEDDPQCEHVAAEIESIEDDLRLS